MAPQTNLAQAVRFDLIRLETEARTIKNNKRLSAAEEHELRTIQERIQELRVQLGMIAG